MYSKDELCLVTISDACVTSLFLSVVFQPAETVHQTDFRDTQTAQWFNLVFVITILPNVEIALQSSATVMTCCLSVCDTSVLWQNN